MGLMSWKKRQAGSEWQENLSNAGKKGGGTNAKRGSEYFRNLARLSAEARKLRKEQGEKLPS